MHIIGAIIVILIVFAVIGCIIDEMSIMGKLAVAFAVGGIGFFIMSFFVSLPIILILAEICAAGTVICIMISIIMKIFGR